MSALSLENKNNPKAQPDQTAGAQIPWGKWGVRTTALAYLSLMLIIPLAVIFQDGLSEGLPELWKQVNLPLARHALWLTLWTSAIMTVINVIMGTLTAYVLVRYEFRGKTLLNSLIDLPLAIPTLVTGVMMVVLFGPQEALGAWLKETFDISIIFAPRELSWRCCSSPFPSWCAPCSRCCSTWTSRKKLLPPALAQTPGQSSAASPCRR